ncbi:MAG: carbon-nitrogen family hydrolase, partial [Leptospiraceae bacterium]|nr:carbon-nitrogen family hydrolase [Leptospiraceae bacterium]
GGWIQENGEKAPLNTFSFFFPNGEVKHYLKNHPFSFVGEEKFYTAGEELCCFDYKGFSLSLLICYDLRFPEIFRRSAGQTDLYLLIANWPDERIEHWDTLLKARAIENQAFVLGVNRVGNTGKRNVKNFPGHTSLYDPFGKNLIQDTGREEIFIVEISKETLQFYRNKFPFLKDRKPVHNPW